MLRPPVGMSKPAETFHSVFLAEILPERLGLACLVDCGKTVLLFTINGADMSFQKTVNGKFS